MGFGKHLKQLRKEKGLTLEEVSRRTGISTPHVSLLERDLRRPTEETARLLAKCFGVSAKKLWLEFRLRDVPRDIKQAIEMEAVKASGALGSQPQLVKGQAAGLRRIPVFDVAAGDWVDFDDGGYPVGFADHYIFLPVGSPHCFACKVTGDSMYQENTPSFAEGDVVVFSPSAQINEGDFVFARGEETGATFKQAFFDNSADTVRLCPLNRRYPEKKCHLAGIKMYKMVFHVKKF